MDLDYLAERFTACTPNASHDDLVGFLRACCDIHERPPAAQDSATPVPLDPDLLALAEGAPSNIVQQIYEEQAMRSSNRPLTGGYAMAYPRRTGRDEDIFPAEPRGLPPRGGMDPDLPMDQDPGAEMTPETLAEFVRICKNRLAANDDNGESHNQFMNLLGEMVANAHQDGMLNGDARKRARDNGFATATNAVNAGTKAIKSASSIGEAAGRRSPGDDFSQFTGRGSMDKRAARDRRAMDSSIAVRSLNAKSFLRRFPEAKNISVR